MHGFIALGSNRGDRTGHLRTGLRRMAVAGAVPTAESGLWETEPLHGAGPDWFLNMAVRIETDLLPHELLEVLMRIERRAGRVRTARNAPRELDLDILDLEGVRIRGERLTVPHPRMWERSFVLAPLAEIDPDRVHPVTGEPIRSVLTRLEDGEVRHRGRLSPSKSAPYNATLAARESARP